jgi:hypothetical protein
VVAYRNGIYWVLRMDYPGFYVDHLFRSRGIVRENQSKVHLPVIVTLKFSSRVRLG